jgi:hypothetical protein
MKKKEDMARNKPKRKILPAKIMRRLELTRMFYPLGRTAERRWARLFRSGFPAIEERFGEIASDRRYRQTGAGGDHILWRDPRGTGVEAMFYFVREAGDLVSVSRLFRLIRRYRPFCTYAVVHQKKDGENCFDIFRATPFSYLEHCNRVRFPLKRK